jgi:hypothetical protein
MSPTGIHAASAKKAAVNTATATRKLLSHGSGDTGHKRIRTAVGCGQPERINLRASPRSTGASASLDASASGNPRS